MMKHSDLHFVTYDDTKMKSQGMTYMKFDEFENPLPFEVMKMAIHQKPLIGIDTCLNLKLLQISEQVNVMTGKTMTREIIERIPRNLQRTRNYARRI